MISKIHLDFLLHIGQKWGLFSSYPKKVLWWQRISSWQSELGKSMISKMFPFWNRISKNKSCWCHTHALDSIWVLIWSQWIIHWCKYLFRVQNYFTFGFELSTHGRCSEVLCLSIEQESIGSGSTNLEIKPQLCHCALGKLFLYQVEIISTNLLHRWVVKINLRMLMQGFEHVKCHTSAMNHFLSSCI